MQVIDQTHGEMFSIYNGDSAEVMRSLPTASVGLSVFSPPFSSLYTYTNSERDLGNCRDDAEFFSHFHFVSRELIRVMKPGRNVCVHIMDLPLLKSVHGVIGMRDFSGAMVKHMVEQGYIYYGRITIDANPQAAACRNKSKSLLFVQLERDSVWSAPVYPDYILLFRTPGENQVPVRDASVTRDEWVEWARPIWYGIDRTNTLNVALAREEEDERHVCPLQLDTIERCVRLWSNKGEVVFSPFAGIGSELYQSVLLGRRAIGIELKPSYYAVACKNLKEAERKTREQTLFSELEAVS